MYRIVLFALFVLLTNSLACGQKNSTPPGILGQQAPQWDVSQWHQLPKGQKSLELNDLSGKTVYLYYFQSWCPGCHSSGFPTLKSVAEHFENDTDVAFVAIQTVFEGHSVNTFKKARAVARKFDLRKIPFGHIAGDSGNPTPPIMTRYRTGGTPWTVIIDPTGKVQFNGFHIPPQKAIEIINTLNSSNALSNQTPQPSAVPAQR